MSITPLVSYSVSLLFQLFIYKRMLKTMRNRFIPMFIAIIITTAGSIPLFILNNDYKEFVYACSPIVQIGLAIMINTSTSLISDVIGKNAESSAFVYGFYGFTEKIFNGFAIERTLKLFQKNTTGLRVIMGGLPIFCSVIAFLLTYLGKFLYSESLSRITLVSG